MQYSYNNNYKWGVTLVLCLFLTQAFAQADITNACNFLYVFEGSITESDLYLPRKERLVLDGWPLSCGVPKPCPGVTTNAGEMVHYDTHTLTNNTSTTQCIYVTLKLQSPTGNITVATYSGNSFNNNNLCQNYLTDPGFSVIPSNPTRKYSFSLPAGQTVTFAVMNIVGILGEYSLVLRTSDPDAPATDGAVSGSTTVCAVNSGTLTLSGNRGSVLNWQTSTNGFATYGGTGTRSTTLPYENVRTTTQFRALLSSSGPCGTAYSTPATVTVNNPIPPTLVTTGSAMVCRGNNSGVLSINGYTGNIEYWIATIEGIGSLPDFNTIIYNTSRSITYNNLSESTIYKAVVNTGSCRQIYEVGTVSVTDASILPRIVDVGASQRRTLSVSGPTAASWPTINATGGSLQLVNSFAARRSIFSTVDFPQPRFWTIETVLCTSSVGIHSLSYLLYQYDNTTDAFVRSYNTIENNAPYFMFANVGYNTLYTLNDPTYGFSSSYDNLGMGFPPGKYNLKIKAMSLPGRELGPVASNTTRAEAGSVLIEREFFFQIVGLSIARQAATVQLQSSDNQDIMPLLVRASPNPARDIVNIEINQMMGKSVNLLMTDNSGRSLVQRNILPVSNIHTESVDVSKLNQGLYFFRLQTDGRPSATLKVIKIE